MLSILCGDESKGGKIRFVAFLILLLVLPIIGFFLIHPLSLFATLPVCIFLIKPVFWNRFGYEIWQFRKNSFSVIEDYKLMKTNAVWKEFEKLNLNYITIKPKPSGALNEEESKEAIFKVITDIDKAQSKRKLPIADVQEICSKIAYFYNPTEKA